MIGPFEFEEDGKIYKCSVRSVGASDATPWWWFQVSGDTNRYAPFQAASRDTRESVKARIIAYYKNHLEHHFAPPPPRGHWSRRQSGGQAAANPAPAKK